MNDGWVSFAESWRVIARLLDARPNDNFSPATILEARGLLMAALRQKKSIDSEGYRVLTSQREALTVEDWHDLKPDFIKSRLDPFVRSMRRIPFNSILDIKIKVAGLSSLVSALPQLSAELGSAAAEVAEAATSPSVAAQDTVEQGKPAVGRPAVKSSVSPEARSALQPIGPTIGNIVNPRAIENSQLPNNNKKTRAVKAAILATWPHGMPDYFPTKDIEEKVVKWCAENGVSKIGRRTIERVLSDMREPPNGDK